MFTYATFMELIIVIFLNAHIAHDDWQENGFVLASFIFWIFTIVLILLLFFVTFGVVCPKYARDGKTEALEGKYGMLLDEVKNKGGW